MDEMRKWLVNYERLRHSKQPNESWISSKYDIEGMHWRDLQQLYLPELGLRWGPACNLLKKLWKVYKIAGRTGEPRSDVAWKITQIQESMGIEKSDFPELQGMEESGGDWNFNFPTTEEGSEYTEEWSTLDKQLLREEREAEDDW